MTEETTTTQTHLTWRGMEGTGKPSSNPAVDVQANRKVLVGVCALFLGALGVHKFLLGRKLAGAIMLSTTVLTLGWGALLMGPIGFIEGILYLTRSDEEFVRRYVTGRRSWF